MNALTVKKQTQLMDELKHISTENQNPNTLEIDLLDAQGILEKIVVLI